MPVYTAKDQLRVKCTYKHTSGIVYIPYYIVAAKTILMKYILSYYNSRVTSSPFFYGYIIYYTIDVRLLLLLLLVSCAVIHHRFLYDIYIAEMYTYTSTSILSNAACGIYTAVVYANRLSALLMCVLYSYYNIPPSAPVAYVISKGRDHHEYIVDDSSYYVRSTSAKLKIYI